MEKQITNLEALKQFGYKELNNCFYKFINENWLLRVDKKTGKLKFYNFVNGSIKDPTPHIQDLIKEGIVE